MIDPSLITSRIRQTFHFTEDEREVIKKMILVLVAYLSNSVSQETKSSFRRNNRNHSESFTEKILNFDFPIYSLGSFLLKKKREKYNVTTDVLLP